MAASIEPSPVVPPDPGAVESWLDYEARGISARRQRLDALVVPILSQGARAYDSAAAWARRHWLLLFNLGNLILTLGTFASPALQRLGWEGAAQALFAAYHLICLQRPSHTWFLWGYPMAMEERMVAITSAQLVAGVIYARVRYRRPWRPLNAWYCLLWSAPLLFDVFSQSLGWRESEPVWRVITGTLFAIAGIWLFYPLFDWAWQAPNHTGKVKLRLNGSWHR